MFNSLQIKNLIDFGLIFTKVTLGILFFYIYTTTKTIVQPYSEICKEEQIVQSARSSQIWLSVLLNVLYVIKYQFNFC